VIGQSQQGLNHETVSYVFYNYLEKECFMLEDKFCEPHACAEGGLVLIRDWKNNWKKAFYPSA
jgi:hypothetical protein